jgi:hypothetical protein
VSEDEMSIALLESLQRANPVRIEEIADRRALPSAHALFAEITAERPRRVRRRTLVIVIALFVLVLAALVGAFALVDRGAPDVTAGPLCYSAASLDARRIATSGGADLRSACAELWTRGDFGSGPVPSHFDVCVLGTGASAVFPGEAGSVCEKLGLRSAIETGLNDRVLQLETEWRHAVRDRQCIASADARDILQRALDQIGFDGWTVGLDQSRPFSSAEPCSSIVVQPDLHEVIVSPISRDAVTPVTG